MLIEHMSKGYSYETFGASVDVSRSVVYDWEKVHPAFLDAKRVAFDKCQLWWEQQGQTGLFEEKEGPKLNASIWIFNMKNRFQWKDRQESTQTIDQTVRHENPAAKELLAEIKSLFKTGIGERK